MNQEIQPLFDTAAVNVLVGSTPDAEVAALPKRRQFSAAYKRQIVRVLTPREWLQQVAAPRK